MSHQEGYTILILGAQPEDAFGLVLRNAFDNLLFLPDQAAPVQKADLAISIGHGCGDQYLQSFIKWTHDAEIKALCVDVRNDAVLIGPLTLSGRLGCGRCALERLTAASATAYPLSVVSRPQPFEELAQKIGPVLVREIQEIVRDGPKQSQLLNHILAVDVETLDESLHKVIPLTRCSICGGAAVFPRVTQEVLRLSAEDSIEVIFEALAGWVDRRTGVISDLVVEPPSDLHVTLPIVATAAPPHLIEKDGSLRRLPLGWGKGLTISGAVLSAVGEAIERYSASLPDAERIVLKRPDELDCEFLDPQICGLYTKAQYDRDDFPYVRFDKNIRHPWVLGRWSDTGNAVWVPALFVFLSIELKQEQLIAQGTSNGLAASTDEDDAALRAILELVERDAFMAAWLTACPGQRLELDDALDPLLRRVLEDLEALGAVVEVYTLPTSVIGTTVLCLAFGDGEQYPGVTFGLGSDLQPHAALKQAVLELGQTGPYLRRMMRSGSFPTPEDPASVGEMLDHAAYYFPRERAIAFDRLRSNEASVRLSDLESVTKRSLANCVSSLKAADVRVALVNVTSADVATGPFSVMRAVSPDLQPIWYGYGLERNPVERLQRLKIASDIPPINPIW
jgi:ribosomal protein S12 methylthiotransferase accessory factor